jgi:hypothetical protein
MANLLSSLSTGLNRLRTIKGIPPKNLTIRFGTHRALVYDTTAATKTAALTAKAKNQVRESHDRELTVRSIRPRILDEELPDYQKLLDNAEVESAPVTLPRLPALAQAP